MKVRVNSKDALIDIMEEYPFRGPLDIVENIKDIIQGKRVCDLGCGKGDLLALMSQYAESVCGVEINKEKADTAKSRGLEIYNDNIYEKIPNADVYYVWVSSQVALVEYLIKIIKHECVFMLGSRKGFKPMEDIVEKYGGYNIYSEYTESTDKHILEMTAGNFKNSGVWTIGLILNTI